MIIICGYGTVGRSASIELVDMLTDHVVVDLVEHADMEKRRFVRGDAGREDVLRKAGIEEAEAIIATTGNDATNALIVLMAKTLNPKVKALVAVKRLSSIEKLYKAQADYVVCDCAMGGRLVVKSLISPYLGDYTDKISLSKDVEITELMIPSNSHLANRTIHEAGIRRTTGVNVIMLKREGSVLFTPGGDTVLRPRDRLVVIGDSDGLKSLSRMMKGGLMQ